MKWRGRRQSSNVSNRGRGRRGAAIGGGGLLIGLLVLVLTGDPFAALNAGVTTSQFGPGQEITYEQEPMTQEEEMLYEYSAVVLADTEDAWNEILAQEGIDYTEPTMYIYEGNIETACGIGTSGMGPFYCSGDETIYMDLSFYHELIDTYGAQEGDFILAYVISHEVAHHVQNETGVLDEVNSIRRNASQSQYNEMTIRLELQADYLAGVVAAYQYEQGYLEPGDIDEAISAAWSIGDDTIQEGQLGYVQPESFTHGTSEQRSRWYRKGFETGDLSGWDTFSEPNVEDL